MGNLLQSEAPAPSFARIVNTQRISHTPLATTNVSSFSDGSYLSDIEVNAALAQHFSKYRDNISSLHLHMATEYGNQLNEHDVIIRHPHGWSIVALKDTNDASHTIVVNL